MKLKWRISTLSFVAIFLILMGYVFHTLALEGDTAALLRETRASLECIQNDQWSGCTGGGQFPLLQKIPSVLLMSLGATDGLMIRFLAGLSLFSFFGILFLSWKYLCKSSRAVALFYWTVLIVGPLVWYARSSFSEMLGAFLIFIFFLSALHGKGPKTQFVLFLVASLAKEVGFPFLLGLGVLGNYLYFKKNHRPISCKPLLPLTLAALGAFALGLAHNYFRYGTWMNESYVQSLHFVPDLRTHASFFAGLLLSGNGGFILFWPLAFGVIALGLFSAKGIARVTTLVCTVLMGGLLFGFSKWAYPFGWVCWGPRFFMPWTPVMVFAVLASDPPFFEQVLRQVGRRLRFFGAALLLFVSFPHALAVFSFSFVYSLFFPDQTCPRPVIIEQDAPYYFSCIEHYIWSKGSLLIQAYRIAWIRPSLDQYAIVPALLLVVIWMKLISALFQELRTARKHRR